MSRWVERSVARLRLEDVEELAGAHDGDALVRAELLQLLVTRDQVLDSGRDGGGQDQVVLGVGGDAVNFGGDPCRCRLAAQKHNLVSKTALIMRP